MADDSQEVGTSLVVVEVLSPSTQYVDVSSKLGGYFDLPSVRLYLVVSSAEHLMIHHRRARDRVC